MPKYPMISRTPEPGGVGMMPPRKRLEPPAPAQEITVDVISVTGTGVEVPTEPVPEVLAGDWDVNELERLTVEELRAMVDSRGHELSGYVKKSDLILLLTQ